MARGEEIEPHVGEFRAGVTFTRYYWQLELDESCGPPAGHHRPARPAGATLAPPALVHELGDLAPSGAPGGRGAR